MRTRRRTHNAHSATRAHRGQLRRLQEHGAGARGRGTAQRGWVGDCDRDLCVAAAQPQARTRSLTAAATAVLIVAGDTRRPCPDSLSPGVTVRNARRAKRRLIRAGCRRVGPKTRMRGGGYVRALRCMLGKGRPGTLHERAALLTAAAASPHRAYDTDLRWSE
ncbi:hypothetical protein C8R47DRAFT_1101752 [Mycena vitilis]|nr:hypothetical protein C8R47DRAFT_1101752 [Mycena vitilis]